MLKSYFINNKKNTTAIYLFMNKHCMVMIGMAHFTVLNGRQNTSYSTKFKLKSGMNIYKVC